MSKLDTQSTDAMHWAEHFCKLTKEQDVTIDEGLMVSWFANYWAAVNDPLQREIERLREIEKKYNDLRSRIRSWAHAASTDEIMDSMRAVLKNHDQQFPQPPKDTQEQS